MTKQGAVGMHALPVRYKKEGIAREAMFFSKGPPKSLYSRLLLFCQPGSEPPTAALLLELCFDGGGGESEERREPLCYGAAQRLRNSFAVAAEVKALHFSSEKGPLSDRGWTHSLCSKEAPSRCWVVEDKVVLPISAAAPLLPFDALW